MRNGLEFFCKTNNRRTWNVAHFHSPHSLTWIWILSFHLFAPSEWKVWPLFASWRDNNGLQWMLRVPFVGFFQWHVQRPMWFRDLYMRMRDEQDRESYERSLARAVSQSAAPKPTVDIGYTYH